MKKEKHLAQLEKISGSQAAEIIAQLSLKTAAPILEARNKIMIWNGFGEAWASELALKLAIYLAETDERNGKR